MHADRALIRFNVLAWSALVFAAMLVTLGNLRAQTGAGGTIGGTIVEGAADRPVEFAVVVLKTTGGEVVAQTTTDRQGQFTLTGVSLGEYRVAYGPVGGDGKETAPFTVNGSGHNIVLGRLELGNPAIKMEAVEVQAKQTALLNSIDRKTYHVGREIQSATGTASDLLQNIPSVNVDIEGGVSLRGSENVMILINGRSSILMGRSRAEALQQLPADGIEKIEVITNPSAKYKPDGTAGIINIVLKQKRAAGLAGTLNTNVGNEGRYNAGVSASYNPGKYNVFANISARQDDRRRVATETRQRTDPATGAVTLWEKKSESDTRPFTRIARAGVEYAPDDRQRFDATLSFDRRTQAPHSLDRNLARSSNGIVTSDYERAQDSSEFEQSWEFSTSYLRKFAKDDHELNLEFEWSQSREREDSRYSDLFRVPLAAGAFDNTRSRDREREYEFVAEYTLPIDDVSKLEAGYSGSFEELDTDFFAEIFNPATGQWANDPNRTNRFVHEETIHAFYLTYGRSFGKLGVLAGLRPEFARVKSTLVTSGVAVPNDYARVYPSLHFAYRFGEQHEFQVNYSHRVERPDSDDLNPFPEYDDPFNVSAGNPALVPEDVHSFEAGYAFQGEELNTTATVYHRKLLHGFTNITREIGNGVLLTTPENLSQSHSTGLELTASGDLGKSVSLNFSSNTYFNTLNAANLGRMARRSDISWSAKLGVTFRLSKNLLLQTNTSYVSSRITAQGSRRPSFGTNIGLRRELFDRKMAVLLTVSDLFNSQKDGSVLETPTLRQEVVRRRSSRIVYLGFVYNFGRPPKKPREEEMKFDDAL